MGGSFWYDTCGQSGGASSETRWVTGITPTTYRPQTGQNHERLDMGAPVQPPQPGSGESVRHCRTRTYCRPCQYCCRVLSSRGMSSHPCSFSTGSPSLAGRSRVSTASAECPAHRADRAGHTSVLSVPCASHCLPLLAWTRRSRSSCTGRAARKVCWSSWSCSRSATPSITSLAL